MSDLSLVQECVLQESAVQESVVRESVVQEKNEVVPSCIEWSIEDVSKWIESIGLPQYQACIETNFINGRKMILLTASNLPRIGIHDFKHILQITKEIRILLNISEAKWDTSIADPPVPPLHAFLEQKSRTGPTIDALTFNEFLEHGFISAL